MKRLSKPQQNMLERLRIAGAEGEYVPMGCGRDCGRHASAWHRTAESLQRRGLIIITREGDVYKAREKS